MSEQFPDIQLLERLSNNEEAALDQIFRQYYAYLCKSCIRVVKTHQRAEDLVQEVFLELWNRRSSLQIKTSLRAYLKRATINKALNLIRDERVKSVGEEPLQFKTAQQDTVQQRMEGEELQQRIKGAIDRLPERCRLVFILSRYEEMSYQQIADKMGISIKTVENQISKALKLLRESLKDYLPRGMAILVFLILF